MSGRQPQPQPQPRALAEPEPVFAEPWQAQAFAIAVELHRRGLFTWREWADALAAEIAADTMVAGAARTVTEAEAPASAHATAAPAGAGHAYYAQWLAALEKLVAAKGAGSGEELERTRRAWARAAARTPHGQAIELRDADD